MIYRFLILFFLSQACLGAANNDPIFLVHGFLGWGRDEMNGYHYWGGKYDYQNELQKIGYNINTLSVGPLSSNWDRAVEAYTQIKGGCVDYGKEHSEKFGIIQRPPGKCYEGIHPQWDENNPIHLIGHSQGGITIRMLEYLLSATFKNEDSSLLKHSHGGWIKSVTTIASPHDGTTLSPIIMEIFPFAQSLSAWVGPIMNKFAKQKYRFDLEQWGISPKEDVESTKFWNDIGKSKIRDSKNFCSWDLSIDGSKEFNSIYRTNKSVYYFSFSTYSTKQIKNSPYYKPTSKTILMFRPAAMLIGKSNPNDSLWNKNDSIVNTISMGSPTSGSHGAEPNKAYQNIPVKGIWQKMESINESHHSIIGVHVSKSKSKEIFKLYKQHCALLYSL